jgi:hypothetical protein
MSRCSKALRSPRAALLWSVPLSGAGRSTVSTGVRLSTGRLLVDARAGLMALAVSADCSVKVGDRNEAGIDLHAAP